MCELNTTELHVQFTSLNMNLVVTSKLWFRLTVADLLTGVKFNFRTEKKSFTSNKLLQKDLPLCKKKNVIFPLRQGTRGE